MNALDLADDLEGWSDTPLSINHKDNVFKEHANMLRQQHAEIEALKAQILVWENAEVPVEVMADIIEELERRGFITK
jgi:hypothetical protein